MRRSVLAEKGNGLKQAERYKGVKEKEVGYSSSEKELPSSNIGMRRRKGELARWRKIKVGRRQNKRRLEAKQLDKSGDKRPPPFNQMALAVLVQ